ncbi:MAG: 5'-methylthioadenosine/adenosylhomocysteine nucleosidase [Eubacteriales bacterium]|nr:5'-methylthioadenosine/adenosylhomocysteine nucleosidase [Eubacteriales bacterium]
MIGIIVAMDVEVGALRDMMTDRVEKTVAGMVFSSGKLCGRDVVMAKSGIGKVFAAMCTQIMILEYSPDIIINSGVAGTLTDKLSIGDIAVANRFVQHDMDTSAIGDPKGLVSGINRIYFDSDASSVQTICDIAKRRGYTYACGTVASGDRFVNDKETKRFITDEFSAIACEMEGGAIAHVCYVNKTPFASIRVISDDAGGDKPTDYNTFVEEAADKSVSLVYDFVNIYKTSM